MTIGVDLPRFMACFNHSNRRQTLDYHCIQPEEIGDAYENECEKIHYVTKLPHYLTNKNLK
jgi:hypothetical protein